MRYLNNKYVLTVTMLGLMFSGCVEDAVLDRQIVEMDSPTPIEVKRDCVVLDSPFSQAPEFADAEDKGFVVTRSYMQKYAVSDTIRVNDTESAQVMLTEDIWSDLDIEVYSYMVYHGYQYRSQRARFRAYGSAAKTVVNSIEIIPDKNDVYGRIIVHGENFSRVPVGPGIKLGREVKGTVNTKVVSSTTTEVVMEYACCNVGDFPMAFTYRNMTFDLGNVLSVHSPKLAQLSEPVYSGVPYRLHIDYENHINEIECTLDDKTISAGNHFEADDEWRMVCVGNPESKHKLEVHFKTNRNEDIWFEPQEVELHSHWKECGKANWSYMPQCHVGGYGWKLTGGWNESASILYRMDVKTGEETAFTVPVANHTADVNHMLGYAGDYNVFGDYDGDKVYCTLFLRFHYNPDVPDSQQYGPQSIRIYSFDINDHTWEQIFEINAPGSQNGNGYQIFAKVDERIYYIKYNSGDFGWYDLTTGQMSDVHNYPNLKKYHNEYAGHSGTTFYFDFYDTVESDINVFSYDPVADTGTYAYKANIINGSRLSFKQANLFYYGHRVRVENDMIYIPYSMRIVNAADVSDQHYYGFPDGVTAGYYMDMTDDGLYAIEKNDGKIWKYEE